MSVEAGDPPWLVRGAGAAATSAATRSLALARGSRALTGPGCVAAAALLGGGSMLSLVLAEAVPLETAPLEPLFAAAVAGAAVAGAFGLIGTPVRLAAERWLLLRAAERTADDVPVPAAERAEVQRGPHDALRALGRALLMVAGLLAVFAIGLWERDAWAPVVRGALPALVGAAAIAGAPLAFVSRRGGSARVRWRERADRTARRWRRGRTPTPRAPRPRSERAVRHAGRAVLLGAALVAVGALLRRPLRYIDPLSYDPPMERIIDGLVLLGILVVALAAVALAVAWLGAAAWRARQERATMRALERGEAVPRPLLDALLLDRAGGERLAATLGLLGWLALALGLAPAATGLLVSAAEATPLQHLVAGAWFAIPALALAWLLGARAARGAIDRRARMQRLLEHDPLPGTATAAAHRSRSSRRRAAEPRA
ncbi:hypothetical protein AA0Z99_01535 [Agrococcus sp. 1P02AA]|uniref:hypothetical protein n=1 Tax=Agrococcus sp. 1P02AA TaxID=3132259 RepID=UPI0039A50FA7